MAGSPVVFAMEISLSSVDGGDPAIVEAVQSLNSALGQLEAGLEALVEASHEYRTADPSGSYRRAVIVVLHSLGSRVRGRVDGAVTTVVETPQVRRFGEASP